MILIDEINGEIARLEAQVQTYQTIDKLAALYIVRDHNVIRKAPSASEEGTVDQVEATSEFLEACAGRSISDVLAVLDELMKTLQVLEPRLYTAVLRRLRE